MFAPSVKIDEIVKSTDQGSWIQIPPGVILYHADEDLLYDPKNIHDNDFNGGLFAIGNSYHADKKAVKNNKVQIVAGYKTTRRIIAAYQEEDPSQNHRMAFIKPTKHFDLTGSKLYLTKNHIKYLKFALYYIITINDAETKIKEIKQNLKKQ